MSEKINLIVTTDAISDIQKAIDKVTELKNAIASVKTVSGSNSFANGTKEQSTEIADLKNKLAMIASLNKQRYEQEAKLIADNDKALTLKSQKQLKQIRDEQAMIASLNKQKNQEILANEKLNRAYVQLTATREKAKNKLQDLIASERASNSEIRKAQQEFDTLNRKVAAADKAVGRFSDSNRRINGLANSVSSLLAAFGISTGIYLIANIAKDIYETTKALQSLDLSLKMVSETSAIYASNTAFITQVSQKWGIEIKGLTEQFTQFYVNAKGKLSEDKIKETFEGIAKAGSLMGISIDKQNNAFYAFNQMLSKGTVQAEELKKQLGNALPGAIKAATMAYQELNPNLKVTEQMMLDQMKAGKLVSSEMVPEIIKAYQKLYGIEMVDKVNTLAASQNRLKNSWTDLVRSMNESETGGISSFFTFISNSLTGMLNQLTRFNSEWDSLYNKAKGKGLAEGQKIALDRFEQGGRTESGANASLTIARKELSKITTELLEVQKEGEKVVKYIEENKYRLGSGTYSGSDLRELRQRKELLIEQKAIQEQIIITTKKLRDEIGKPPKNINQEKETEEQRNARLKTEKERLGAIEKNAKIEYDLALSNAERKKEIIEDELDVFKGSIEEKIKLSMRLALIQNDINKIKYKEDVRQAKGDTRLISIADNVEFKAQGDSLQSHLKRVGSYYSEYFKSLEKMPKTIFGDKFKLTPEQEQELKEYNEKLKDTLRQQIKIFNDFVGDFANRSGFAQTFDSFIKEDANGVSLMDTLFDDDAIMDKEAKMKATFLAISSAAQDMFNIMSEASQRNFDAEYNRLDEQKEAAIGFAGDSTAAKEKIEADYEKKRKQIAIREAKAKKAQAMVNIAIDTAQAVMATLGKGGFFASPLAIAVAAMGAIQLAMVSAQKIPEYWRGTNNAQEGFALTNERGAEIHTDRHGNIKDFGHNKGATLTKMDAGDIVYTAEESRRLMFENEYHGLLRNNGINGAKPSNGMTASDMEAVMVRTLGGRPILNMNFDKGGFGSYISKNGNITKQSESRGSGRGIEI